MKKVKDRTEFYAFQYTWEQDDDFFELAKQFPVRRCADGWIVGNGADGIGFGLMDWIVWKYGGFPSVITEEEFHATFEG